MQSHFDIAIIGSGPGGGTLAYALRDCGARICVLERGSFLRQEPENWDPEAVTLQRRYCDREETWTTATGRRVSPLPYYFVGGASKVYAAALMRLRAHEFEAAQRGELPTPAWPVSYSELEPFYAAAEKLYCVHGRNGEDPTEPSRSTPYPFPPVPHAPYIEELLARFRGSELRPFHLPVGLDLGDGRCIRCDTCDGYPCKIHAKADADVVCVRPAVAAGVTLLTGAYVRQLVTDASGKRVTSAVVERAGASFSISADRFVVAGGAVNSAALLLRSASDRHPRGLANSSDTVGRHLMAKNMTFVLAVHPSKENPPGIQKTWAIHDFDSARNPDGPCGAVQGMGRLQPAQIKASGIPGVPLDIGERAVGALVMSECRPDPENRVSLDPDGSIRIAFRPNHLPEHFALVDRVRDAFASAGYPVVIPLGANTLRTKDCVNQWEHLCGTTRMGSDPTTSVVDPGCRTHDVDNLYVVDASVFPSQGTINPSLTIIANALRVGERVGRDARSTARNTSTR